MFTHSLFYQRVENKSVAFLTTFDLFVFASFLKAFFLMGLFPPKQNEIGYIYFLILVRFDISLMLFNDISSRPDIRLHYWAQAALCPGISRY